MAGRIPQEFLDQLLGRVDLVEIVNSRAPLRRAGRKVKRALKRLTATRA